MKIKKQITFEGKFITGDINDNIVMLKIEDGYYEAKQVSELMVELQKVLQELPKDYLTRESIKDGNSMGDSKGISTDVGRDAIY